MADTIKLEGWNLDFDIKRYREVIGTQSVGHLFLFCETPEETKKVQEFLDFKNFLADRQYKIYLEEQQG